MSAINATTGGTSGAGGTPQNGGGLKGISPTPFNGDRSQSTQFKREMLRFIKLNSEHELIKEYYSRILYCLTLFRGQSVMMWVNEVEDAMERELADTTNTLTKKSEELWKTFLDTFNRDWTDTLNKEKAYQQLINLRMQPGQLDEYILTFERLAGIAGWDKDAPGTIEFFKKGLPLGLYRACLMRETIPKNMADWQKTARMETQRFKLILIGPGAKSSGPTQNTRHNRPKARDPNAMDVDATTSSPFKKLSDEEHKQYMKEGRCFQCHQQGHMAKECTCSPPPKQQTQARATDTKKAEAEEAPPYTPEASLSRVATTTTEDKVCQAHNLLQLMNEEEKRHYYALDQDFCNADL